MQRTDSPHLVSQEITFEAKFLIVDDDQVNVRLLESILTRAGFTKICCLTDPRKTIEAFDAHEPDIVLLDLNMPYLDGFEVIRVLGPKLSLRNTPVIMLTADTHAKTKHRALSLGAKDFLTKPFDEVEVLLRINNLLETHFHQMILEAKVQERTRELRDAQLETLSRLALASEYRDDNTGLHARRVGRTSGLIATALGMSKSYVDLITQAASLHDVGKIGIPDSILLKPGKLTDEEFHSIKEHTKMGAKILSGSKSSMLQLAEEIALYHHEFWDGKGYAKLKGEEIPLSGRIVGLADFFDALTHARPYKWAWTVEQSIDAVRERSGSQFDPQVVAAFLTLDHHQLVI